MTWIENRYGDLVNLDHVALIELDESESGHESYVIAHFDALPVNDMALFKSEDKDESERYLKNISRLLREDKDLPHMIMRLIQVIVGPIIRGEKEVAG